MWNQESFNHFFATPTHLNCPNNLSCCLEVISCVCLVVSGAICLVVLVARSESYNSPYEF